MGRPSYSPAQETRRTVGRLKRAGLSDERIAERLGISRGTLLKHFGADLEDASDAFKDELLELMWRAAKRGNAAAIKWLARKSDQALRENQP